MVSAALAPAVCGAFVALALWHFYMALRSHGEGAVPSVNGRPLFVPSRGATVAVGMVLVLFAALVAATAGLLAVGLPRAVLSWLSYGLALGLLLRAVGEFKYVGLFKRIRGTKSPFWTRSCIHPCACCWPSAWRWWPCGMATEARSSLPVTGARQGRAPRGAPPGLQSRAAQVRLFP
jgi:Protein of unknown function (DUF3995)